MVEAHEPEPSPWWARSSDVSYAERRYWDERYKAQLESCIADTSAGTADAAHDHAAPTCQQHAVMGNTAATPPDLQPQPSTASPTPSTQQAAGGAVTEQAAALSRQLQDFEFDWLCEYESIRPLLLHLLNPSEPPTDQPPDTDPSTGSLTRLLSHLRAAESQQHPDTGLKNQTALDTSFKDEAAVATSLTDRAAPGTNCRSTGQHQGAGMATCEPVPGSLTQPSKAQGIASAGQSSPSEPCTTGGPLSLVQGSCPPAGRPLRPLPPTVLDLGAGNSLLLERLCAEQPCIAAFAVDYSPMAFQRLVACHSHLHQHPPAPSPTHPNSQQGPAAATVTQGATLVSGQPSSQGSPEAAKQAPAQLPGPGELPSEIVHGAPSVPSEIVLDRPSSVSPGTVQSSSAVPPVAMQAPLPARPAGVLPEAVVADARSPLPFLPGSIGLVIDKGCLDAVLNDWDQHQLHSRWERERGLAAQPACGPAGAEGGASSKASQRHQEQVRAEQAARDARAMLHQVGRVLAPGGHLCIISYEPPRGRAWLLGDHVGSGAALAAPHSLDLLAPTSREPGLASKLDESQPMPSQSTPAPEPPQGWPMASVDAPAPTPRPPAIAIAPTGLVSRPGPDVDGKMEGGLSAKAQVERQTDRLQQDLEAPALNIQTGSGWLPLLASGISVGDADRPWGPLEYLGGTGATGGRPEHELSSLEGSPWQLLAAGFEHEETGNYLYILQKLA